MEMEIDSVPIESPSAPWQRAIIVLSRTFSCLILVVALSWGRPVLIPVAVATLLTFLLNPVVRMLQRFGMGRVISVLLAVSAVGTVVTVVGFVGSRQVTSLLSELPANTAKITAKVKTLKAVTSGPSAKRFEEMIEEISREFKITAGPNVANVPVAASDDSSDSIEAPIGPTIVNTVMPHTESYWRILTGYLGSAFEIMATFAFALVLLVFFLLERDGLRDRIVLLAGKTRLTLTSKALEDASNRVSRYIVMVAMVNGGFGILLTIGLLCLGVPYAVLWGCVAALLRFVPYIGPWVGAIFPITLSLAMSEGWWQPISVFVFVMALELVANNAVEPIVFGRTTGVAPAALLISAAFWLYLWGPIGLIISAPFAVCLVVMGKNIPQLSFLNVIMGDEPALSANVGFYQRLLVRDQCEATTMITNRLQEADSERVFDELLIPALNYARRDVRKGHLSDGECDSLLMALGDSLSIVDLHSSHARTDTVSDDPESSTALRQLTLLGCSADGDVDRTALEMLKELLDPLRWKLELVPAGVLTSEIADRVARETPAAICIASLPPDSIAHARYLCKKLRAAAPDVPIIIGRWGQGRIRRADHNRLRDAGATEVTGTLLETRQWLRSRHPFIEASKPVTAETNPLAGSGLAMALAR